MRKQMIHVSLLTFALSILFTACDKDVLDWNSDPFKDQSYVTKLNSPISTFLSEQTGYEEYVKTLQYSDMFNALNQSSSGISFTAFVPNNSAMQEFYKRRGVNSLEELSRDYARQFVLYHTVKDSILPDAFVQKDTVHNLNNDVITIKIDSIHAGQATLNSEGRVVEMGLSAFNGKIYVLSSAMTPLVETVYDRIVASGKNTIMTEALQATGWANRLNTVVDTTLNQDRQRVITRYYYTVLNVSDAVFAKSGITSLADLRAQLLSRSQQSISEDSLLKEYVGYHILKNQYKMAELGAMNGSNITRIWSSSARNQVFTVTYDSLATDAASRYVLNASGEPAHFIPESSDVLSKNGYVHELDAWMPVWEPVQAEVLWDFADYTEVKNLVDGEFYQPSEPTSSEERFDLSKATCFEYELGEAGTKNNSYHHIDYVTCRNNMKTANNLDRVVFNVGYMGKVSMNTPTIVRGKYRVELTLIYMTGHTFMRQKQNGSNGGQLKIMFDDNDDYMKITAPYTKVTSALPGVYSSTLYDEIEFSETSSHRMSFVVLDPAASTNGNFSLQLDCIRFIPIE